MGEGISEGMRSDTTIMGLIQQCLLLFLLLIFIFYQSSEVMFQLYQVHEMRVLGFSIELDREQIGAILFHG